MAQIPSRTLTDIASDHLDDHELLRIINNDIDSITTGSFLRKTAGGLEGVAVVPSGVSVVVIDDGETKTCGLTDIVLLGQGGTLNLPATSATQAGAITVADLNAGTADAWSTIKTAIINAANSSTIGNGQNNLTGTNVFTVDGDPDGEITVFGLASKEEANANWIVLI